jgi:Flp pilus assembly protein TadG
MGKKILRNEKGTGIVEFAIILPLLILLIFGMVEFGFFLYNQAVITNASREGARAGIVQALARPTVGEIQNVVNVYCTGHLINVWGNNWGNGNGDTQVDRVNSIGSVVASGAGCTNTFGDSLRVTVAFDYNFLMLSFLGTKTLTAVTIMKCE